MGQGLTVPREGALRIRADPKGETPANETFNKTYHIEELEVDYAPCGRSMRNAP